MRRNGRRVCDPHHTERPCNVWPRSYRMLSAIGRGFHNCYTSTLFLFVIGISTTDAQIRRGSVRKSTGTTERYVSGPSCEPLRHHQISAGVVVGESSDWRWSSGPRCARAVLHCGLGQSRESGGARGTRPRRVRDNGGRPLHSHADWPVYTVQRDRHDVRVSILTRTK